MKQLFVIIDKNEIFNDKNTTSIILILNSLEKIIKSDKIDF